MSGGEPSSIKQKPSCAAELPILSPKCGKAAGCVFSNCLRAVLWSTELIRLKPRFQSNGIYRSLRLGYIPTGQKFLPMVETFAPTCIKTEAHVPGFYAFAKQTHGMRAAARAIYLRGNQLYRQALRRAYARLFFITGTAEGGFRFVSGFIP